MAKRPKAIPDRPTPEELALAARVLNWAATLRHNKEATSPSLVKTAEWLDYESTQL